jgi:hypothetical protein
MIRPTLTCKKLFLAVVLSFFWFSLIAADRYSVATGNWNDISTWSATSGGASGASFPIAGDNVFIEGGFTVTTAADAACANLNIANGATLSVAGFNITVSGTTTVNGTINHTSTTGTKTFTGLVTINATGIWNNNTVNAPINFRGGISNSGTFNAGTGTYTFNTNNQALTGTLSIPSVTVTGVTLTNNGTLTVSTGLAGTGGLTQAVNATLNLGGTSAITTLTATNNGNTVNFSGAAQTAKVSSYYNLTLSGTGVKTFATTPTVNGILSMEGTATVVVTAGVVTYGANATLQYNTTTARTATAEEWIVPFAATGGVIIANTGTITMNVAKVFNASVPLAINSGATLATNNLQLTFGGNFVNGGSLSAGSSPIVITNTMAAQNISGFSTTGQVLLSKTAGTATFTGNVNGNGLTINGVGGTLNLGSGLTHTFTGTWTSTNGTLNGGSSLLRIGGSVSGTGGTFTAGSGTVEWYAGGAQTCAGVTYNNLTLSGSGAKTVAGATINGILSLEGTATAAGTTPTYGAAATLQYKGSAAQTTGIEFPATFNATGGIIVNNVSGVSLSNSVAINSTLTLSSGTFSVGANTLTLNGPTIAGTPANLSTTASSSLVFGGTTSGVLIPTSVVALNGLSITNTSLVTLQSSLTVSGTLNSTAGGLSIGANTLTLNGQINCGTLTGGATSNVIIAGAGTANFPPVTLNNLTIDRAVSMCGNVTVGGVLILSSGALSIGANTLTLSNGANLSYSAGSLTGGATSNLTIGTGTDITLNAILNGLNNFNTSRNIILGANLSINGTLTLAAGTFTVGPTTLTLNGPTIAGTPGNLTTSSFSSLSFGGSSAGVSIPGSVINLNNLTINNINGVTMNSNITLTSGGVLTLTNGIVQAGANILKITNTNPAAAVVWTAGSFVNVTSGAVERTLAAGLTGTGNDYLFPIGEGSVFKGIRLRDVNTGATGPVLQAKVNATGALTGDGTTIGSVDPRYWSLANLNSGNLTSAKVELYESGLDYSKTICMSAAVPGNYSAIGGSSNTSSVISPSLLNPGPYFCIGKILHTYYSYQTGNWNTPTTWTSDPSGTLQIGSTIPGDNDKVRILTGRTVSFPGDITNLNLDITIDAGGFLDQGVYRFTNSLFALRGQGTLRLASVNFPSATTNTFTNAGGGTTEYNNAANFTLPAAQTTYNNLTINTSDIIATQLNDITLNGNLYVKRGTFQINNNISVVKLTLTVNGNVTVDNGAFITVGNGVTNTAIGGAGGAAPFLTYYLNFHTVIIKGDFTNNGTVRFTNLPYPLYNAFPPLVAGATSGAASVYFQGTSDNILNCNGITNFYNLILDKGIDQTYKLTINSTNYTNFKLFGANISSTDGAITSDPNLRKALWIRTGTLVLSGSLIIPSLSEGIAANSDYYIPSKGALIVDGVDVVVLSTADDYREINAAYTVTAPDNSTIGVTKGGVSAVDIFGKLQINNGYLSTRESGGLITSTVASGQIIINGGTIDAKQFLSSTGSASFTQTGGLLILRGRFQRTPAAYSTVADLTDVSVSTLNTSRATNGIDSGFGSFNLEQTANIFNMSGGAIRIYDVCGIGGVEQKAFDVKSSTSNINVTGGTLEIRPTTGTVLADAVSYFLNSNSPLYNILIDRASSASVVQLNTSPLVVLKDLILSSGDFSANNLNVTVGGNFSIAGGTSYTAGTNTTAFNGTGNQTFTINLAAPLSLNKLTIDKPAGVVLNFAGTQTIINVSDNFRLVAGTMNDNGNTINVAKNIFNSGLHSGTGKIVLNGTLTQSIDGNGIFGSIELNNTNTAVAPVSLLANMSINGVLTFSQNKLFDISIYNLKLNSSASIANGSATRYIQTAGNAGDGGVTKVYSTTAPFTFPVGAPTIVPARPVKYTPAVIGFSSAPAGYGSITVNPVGYEHPSTTINGQSLTYFWRIKSSGFTGIVPNSVTHSFIYDQSDVAGNESNYIPSLYTSNDFTWRAGTNANPPINIASNLITDWTTPTNSTGFLDADYTAGDLSFGAPLTFYSIANSAWNINTTWSYTSGGPAVPAGAAEGVNFPGPNSIVIIENNRTVNLTADQRCASLQIQSGSTLDIYTWTGSIFSMVMSNSSGNNGLFRLTTTVGSPKVFSFPANSDFSDFNNNHGTTEFYDIDGETGHEYILPPNVTTYGNLILTAKGGDNLILPNNSYTTIKGDLTCTGDNPDAWVTMSWLTDVVYTPTIEKTIHVTGNMFINNGTFLFLDDQTPQHLIVDGNVTIAPGAVFDTYNNYPVNNGGATRLNSFEIGGSFINNSNVNPSARFINGNNYVNLTFSGNTNASITSGVGSVPNTIFNNVTINKGNSQVTTLTCDIAGALSTPANNWLTLQNGTFRYMRTNPGSDFTISTIFSFNIPSTAGLYIDYSNTGARNILIGNDPSNNNDLILDGKLTVVNGSVYIGQVAAPANNNDIEYSGSGNSAIEIRGGTLTVNGQIRRPATTTNGVLNYTQSGGNVIINGNNSLATKAKLEVLNGGSVFNMSGGTLTIVRGGGTTYGDLYLRPVSSSVTGGTIVFTNVLPNTLQNYLMDANIPLNNLTVTGAAGAGVNAILGLIVSPLELNGTLTLSNAQSILNSNNINVLIKGNLVNNGTYTFGTNTTTFNGGIQTISGGSVTNFNNLNVSSVNSLTVNNSFAVNQDLFIGSGTLILGNKKLTLSGNIVNNGTYTDDNNLGGISLSGTVQQQISGAGAFGKLEINNGSGVKLNNGIILQNNLVLTQGIFNINSNLLTLSQNSSIIGSPGINKMIMSDGVISSPGVRKFFTAVPQSFTFPVGVSGKYTPAIFTITANATVGYINVNPVDNRHQSVLDPLNVLQYYWQIESSGISGFAGNVLLQYLPGDVAGVESNYVAAKLVPPAYTWSKAPSGPATDNVDEINHQINFIFSGSSNLNADYTAGKDIAFPIEVPTYETNNNGNWSDQTIWAPVGSSPPCPAGGPTGANVIIDHIVTINTSNIFVVNTTINNELRIVSPTLGHNLGNVDGNGKIYLEMGNLPGGNYTSFVDCTGNGTVEYGGTGNYTIIASQFSNLPNMLVTGTGTRVLPNKDLTICKRLLIDGPVLDNSVNNSKLIINGSMELYSSGGFLSGSGTSPASTVTFAGTSIQTLGGPTGNFTGSNKFNNLEINNPSGLTIGVNGLVEVNNKLLLTNGIINTTSANKLTLLSTSSDAVTPSGGSATSFINGPLIKQIVNGGSFLYPIGKGTIKGHNFTLTSTAGSTLAWTAEYFTPNPTATSLTPPLLVSNTMEYWSVSTSAVTTAKVKIGWDPFSVLTPLMTVNGIADMRVAQFNAGSWNELASTATGDNNNGDVATVSNVNISPAPKNYTTASITPTIARASLSPAGPACGTAGIPVSFTSFDPITLNYTLNYTINSVAQLVINITSLPYTLPTPIPGAYKLTGFSYNNGANTGVVDETTINVYTSPPVSNAGPDQSLCGISGTVLAGSNPAPYSGLWTIVSGAGGTLINRDLNTTVFTGASGGTYTLRWTISNFTCTSSDEVIISFPVAATRPSKFTSAPPIVCQGSTGNVYTVPNVPGNTYNWSYSGTGHTINGTGNSVTIDFNTTATSGTLSVTATNACGTSPARTVNITVNLLPVATFSYSGTPYCPNAANPSPTFSGGGVAGTFSSTAGLVFVSTATGQVNLAASTIGSYIVTNTIAAAGGCGVVTATSPITIISDLTWTGAISSDWNVAGNWSCGILPALSTTVQIPNVPNKPVLSAGATGTVKNLTIATGSSLIISGNTLQIAGTIANNGTFDASNGTIVMNGSSAQTIGATVFSGNTIRNLTISNAAGVSFLGPLNVTGIVNIQIGTLASGGFLTLASSASGTALIDGSGGGTVTGNVTIQRYLPSKFGYKYISSPFQSATVNELSDDIDLGASFPALFRYNEGSTTSGWVDYITNADPLSRLLGYAANFGSSGVPFTADISGTVNNGPLSITLYNHNNPYTLGFNLVGNPYPSPVDWDAASGWTKTNIDNALYYFKASTTDEYGGTYSTYINGISSDGIATAIIPSMQGFFIHVYDGSYPVTGTLGLNNSVRVTDLTHSFVKSGEKSPVPLIRLGATFADGPASTDPMVIYFDEKAQTGFDTYLDARKLMNTDYNVPNLYAFSTDGTKLSIDALPESQDSLRSIPLGLKANIDGNIVFRIIDLVEEHPWEKIYLTDLASGTENDLLGNKEYRVYLEEGEYNNRFFLNLLKKVTEPPDTSLNKNPFTVYSTHGIVKAYINTDRIGSGLLSIYNLTGQVLFTARILDSGYYEFNPGFKNGIYVVRFVSKIYQDSKKIFIQNR